MTLPTISGGIDISATGGRGIYSPGMATSGGNGNGHGPAGQTQGEFDEAGFPGVLSFGGYIQQAYQRELYWPGVYPLYNRLRRSDPEVSVVRQIFSAVAGDLQLEFKGPEENATPDDERAVEFANSVLADLEGGIERFRDTLVSHVPFMGWGWWEAVPGLRRKSWRPPDKEGEPDEWRSKFDDGLTGFRRLAFRDHSSFLAWDISLASGKLRGIKQLAIPHPLRTIPLDSSVHITFGDTANPEGLTPLEGLWRLERIKYGLEVVQGMGYEHAAGYLNVNKTSEGAITEQDKTNIRAAARAILTAQEGNYAAWPTGFTGKVEDVPFTAGAGILEAIRYYGLLKLALFNAQWVGMSSLTDRGSYSALHDASSTWMVFFNAMMSGFAQQLDAQLGARLFAYNAGRFPGMTERPHLTISPVEKFIELEKLAPFLLAAFQIGMPLAADDYLAIRKKSGFLPEVLPEAGAPPAPDMPDDTGTVGAAEREAEDGIDPQAAAGFTQERKVTQMTTAPQTLAQLADGYTDAASHYRLAVYNATLEYLLRDGARATSFKADMGQAMLQSFSDTFYAAYRSGGGEEVEPEDDRWLTDRTNSELANIAQLFVSLKAIKDEKLPPGDLIADANRRADGYADALRGVWSQGLLRGQRNVMLTLIGADGKVSCRDCQRLKGQRHSAAWWINHDLIPYPGNSYECGGWNCKHVLQDAKGQMYTLPA